MTTYNTGNPVGSTDPRDLYDNAQNLDNIVNGSELSYADRLGVARRSLAGIDAAAEAVLSGLGYAAPVPYSSGISLTLTTQTVEYNGEVYAPKLSALPLTTGATFDPTKFRLIQGVVAADLAAPGGSALVGYDGGTVQAVLDEAKPMADYTALRAYTGRATGVRITQTGLAGFFQRDDADTTSADNGGTIIVDASGRRWKRLFGGAVNVFWFMTSAQIADIQAGTSALDVSSAINVLIAYLTVNADGANSEIQEIYFPVGWYRLDNPINLTTDNTHFYSRLILRGSGWQTVLLGNTGKQMVDFTGSYQNMIKDMRLEVSGLGTNPSTIGVFFHRGADTTQCIYHRLSNVYMDMRSNPAANNGVGTVGIWNVEGENHNYHNVYINANRAMVMTKYPTGLAYSPTSYVSLYTSQISCGSNVVTGDSMFIGWDRHFPPIYLDGVTHCDLGSAYINNQQSPYGVAQGTYNFGIEVKDAFQLKHFGLVEGVNQYMRLTRTLIAADLNIEIPSTAATSLPIIDMTPANANTVILNSRVQILNNDTTRVFAVTADKDPTYTSQVRCTQITGYNIFPRLPKALAFRSSEYSVESESNRIAAGLRTLRREIEQLNVTVGGLGTPQDLFEIQLPTVVSGNNAGALVAKVEGTIFTSGDVARTFAPAQLTFTSYVDVGQTAAGVISVGTPTTTVNSTFNPNPATADITGVTVSTSLSGTTLTVRIVFSASGTNSLDNIVFFQGNMETSWTGYQDEAPQIN